MAKVTILIEDNDDGTIRMNTAFGEGGIDEESYAHYAAAVMIKAFSEEVIRSDEDDAE